MMRLLSVAILVSGVLSSAQTHGNKIPSLSVLRATLAKYESAIIHSALALVSSNSTLPTEDQKQIRFTLHAAYYDKISVPSQLFIDEDHQAPFPYISYERSSKVAQHWGDTQGGSSENLQSLSRTLFMASQEVAIATPIAISTATSLWTLMAYRISLGGDVALAKLFNNVADQGVKIDKKPLKANETICQHLATSDIIALRADLTVPAQEQAVYKSVTEKTMKWANAKLQSEIVTNMTKLFTK